MTKKQKLEIITVNEIVIFGKKFMSRKDGWYYPLDETGNNIKRMDKTEFVLKEIQKGLETLDAIGQTKNIKNIRLSARTAACAMFSGEINIRRTTFSYKDKWVECIITINGHPHPVRIYPEIEDGVYATKDEKLI